MCQLCGCTEYTEQGKEATLRRAVEIIGELGLTADNVDDFEEIEIISRWLVPIGPADDDIYELAAWMGRLHMGQSGINRKERYQAHVNALRDVFSRLPAKGEPKHIATVYHQLEQLGRELDDADLTSIDPATGRALKAVNHVHEGMEAKEAKLKQHYGL